MLSLVPVPHHSRELLALLSCFPAKFLVEIHEKTVLGCAPSSSFMFSLLSSPPTPCSVSHRGSEALFELYKQIFAPVPFLRGSALT